MHGPISTVASDVSTVRKSAESIGLHLNSHKCEIITQSATKSYAEFDYFNHITPEYATLLGAPLTSGTALDTALKAYCENLKRAVDRLQQ